MGDGDAAPADGRQAHAAEDTLVWGAGAIGGTIAAYALRAGHPLTLVDVDRAHVEAMRARGIAVRGPLARFHVPVRAMTPDEVSGKWRTVLLCTKAQHTEAACRALRPHLAENGCVVSVQNGLNELTIAEMIGAERTVGAFVNFGADYLEPGIVHYGGRGAVVVGELDGRTTDRVQRIRELLAAFEPNATVSDNLWGFLWGKMAYGAMLFATALTHDAIADALDDVDHRGAYVALAAEVLAACRAEGVRPEGFNGFDPEAFGPAADPAATDASFAAMVAFNRRSAKTHSGIWRDLAVRKRETEAQAQLGAVVRAAERHGIETPHLRRLIALVREIETGEREQHRDNLRALATPESAA